MQIRDEHDAQQVRNVRAAIAEAYDLTQGGALREVWAELGRRIDERLVLPDQESAGIASPIS